ncbi:hypothetical protein Tco_0519288 [Tanacetum coccineum]
MGLWYSKDTDMSLTAYADADHAGCQDTRRSTSGSSQFLGDKLFSWSSKRQKSTTISSTEAEYITLSGNMNSVVTQQVALDNALVDPAKRLKIERCNARIEFSKLLLHSIKYKLQKTTLTLKLSPCYLAFWITAEVLEIYMHQFWNTLNKIRNSDAYNFKLDKKKCRVDTKVYREILYIYPRILNQEFVVPPSEDELVLFIKELGYLADVKCYLQFIQIKCTSLGEHLLLLSTGVSMGKQQDLIDSKNDELKSCGFVSKTNESRKYRALIPYGMINQDIKDSEAYKTYYDYASGKFAPKKARKYKKIASPSRKLSPVLEAEPVKKPKRNKAPAKVTKDKGIDLLSDVALLEAIQLKKALKESKQETHKVHDSGSSEGVGSQPKVPNEHEDTTAGTNEGTDDESNDDSDDDNDDDNKDDDSKNDDDGDSDADDSEKTDSNDDENPKFTLKEDEEEENEEEYVILLNMDSLMMKSMKTCMEIALTSFRFDLVLIPAKSQTSSLLTISTPSTAATTTIPPSILSVSPLP